MNTNSNTYTIIYTSLVVVVVAAVLAFVSQTLKPKQDANDKAETISQILTAGQFASKDSLATIGNVNIIKMYQENISEAVLVNALGQEVASLDCAKAEVYSVSQLKAQNYKVADYLKAVKALKDAPAEENEAAVKEAAANVCLPVYTFKNGIRVMPIYGAGLWGPVWGYIAFNEGTTEIAGAYFDHASETPGLGGKIQEDPAFRAQFVGKTLDYAQDKVFAIVKGGAQGAANGVDAIQGATMTSGGLERAINDWVKAYRNYLETPAQVTEPEQCCGPDGCCAEVEPSNVEEN